MNKRDLDLIELALYLQAMFRVMERKTENGEHVDSKMYMKLLKERNEELFKGEK